MTEGFSGKVALVTGASGGLGEHIARLLVRQGAAVAVAARRLDRVEALAADLRSAGGKAMAVSLDVTAPETFASVFDGIEAGLGPVDILVNNAGVSGEGAALSLSVEAFDNAFDVNVRGAYFAAAEAARRMIAAGREGRVLNIASIAGHTVLPGLSAYCASKAALIMLTRSLAREWARRGVAVNALCPGYVETDINADWWPTEGGRKQLQGFPRRRLMEASDLDAAILLLTAPSASAITGSILTVDDGQSLPGGG